MRCNRCRRDAVLFQPYSGLHLCTDHFIADFEAKVKKTIRKHHFIHSGDRIGIAMSGGKDSSAILAFLHRVFGERPDLSLIALTVDEGIGPGRNLPRIAQIAAEFGVPHVSTSFRDEFGFTLDQIVAHKGEDRSCTWCGVLRRRALNRLALANGVTRLAMGFNLDDEAQSVLLNVLRGDVARLMRSGRKVEQLVPRIKPFRTVPEREVALYAHIFTPSHDRSGCPYAHNALRGEVRGLLNAYERQHPGTKYALVNLGEKIARRNSIDENEISVCPDCGEPCAGACRACEILRDMREFQGNGDSSSYT